MLQVMIPNFGDAEVLTIRKCDPPTPSSGQLLLRVHYAAINPIDCKTRAGLGWAACALKDKLPWVPGYDLAGEVVAMGEGVDGFTLGQRVFGMTGFPHQGGAYSQFVLATPDEIVPVPDGLMMTKAAALPIVGLTARQALFEQGQLHSGQTVLILGAGGAVGQLATQLAVNAGANVYGVGRVCYKTPFKLHGGIELYQLSNLPLGLSVDLVIDLIGGDTAQVLLGKLASFERLVTVPTVSADAITAYATSRGTVGLGMMLHPDRDALQELAQWLARGRINLAISDIFSLPEVVRSHQRLERGGVGGKLLLQMFEVF